MTSNTTTTRPRARLGAVAAALICTGAMVLGVGGLAGVAAAEPAAVHDATLAWRLNDEANIGTFNGECNYMSAGRSDGTVDTYAATDRSAAVTKLDASGADVPIADYATRCLDSAGAAVTPFRGHLGQTMRFSDGTGTVDRAAGTATIQWSGAVTVNFYGGLVPFWIEDPRLEVHPDGTAELTARLGGFASSMDDPTVRTPIDPVDDVVIARMVDVDVASSAFTATPLYDGVTYEGDPPQLRVLDGWGSWPAPLVDFHTATGLASYWYSTGGASDARKAPAPITVQWAGATAPTTTTTVAPSTTTSIAAPTTTAAPSSTTTSLAAAVTTTTASPASAPDSTGPSGVLGAEVAAPLPPNSTSTGSRLAFTGGSQRAVGLLGAALLLSGAVALRVARRREG